MYIHTFKLLVVFVCLEKSSSVPNKNEEENHSPNVVIYVPPWRAQHFRRT